MSKTISALLLVGFLAVVPSIRSQSRSANASAIVDSRTAIAAAGTLSDADTSFPSARPRSTNQPAAVANFIVKIREGNLLVGGGYGHGICLDSPCAHVLTNYHVAGLLLRIRRRRTWAAAHA